MQDRGVDPGRFHLGQRIVDVVGRDLPVMRRHLAVFPDVDLRVDDQHGVPPRRFVTLTLGRIGAGWELPGWPPPRLSRTADGRRPRHELRRYVRAGIVLGSVERAGPRPQQLAVYELDDDRAAIDALALTVGDGLVKLR